MGHVAWDSHSEGDKGRSVRYVARPEEIRTEVMQDIVAAAVLDAIAAFKAASRGLPTTCCGT